MKMKKILIAISSVLILLSFNFLFSLLPREFQIIIMFMNAVVFLFTLTHILEFLSKHIFLRVSLIYDQIMGRDDTLQNFEAGMKVPYMKFREYLWQNHKTQ